MARLALAMVCSGAPLAVAAVGHAEQAPLAENGSKLLHSTAQRPKVRGEGDGWLDLSLQRYLEWREALAAQPEQARNVVEEAEGAVRRDAKPLPIARGVRALRRMGATTVRATLEQRGMLVWRTLETVIDRERVDRALRVYYERYRGKAASLEDFRKICEEISGRDLRWFFDYYLRGTELPEIILRRVAGSAPNEVAGEIVVQNAPPEYQVRVELRLYTAAGVTNHSVATNGTVTPFTVTSKEPVTRIVVDPDSRILRRVAGPKP